VAATNKRWTALEKIVLITGGSNGIGLQAAIEFAKLGATVIIGCRDKSRGEAALIKIRKESGLTSDSQRVVLLPLELSQFASIRSFVKEFEARFDRIDILVNNAAIIFQPFRLTEDGLESTMATNYFGPFLLTNLILPLVKKTGGRIVNVSSAAHAFLKNGMEYDLLCNPSTYNHSQAYSMSKLGNIWFTKELQRRLSDNNERVTVYSTHPGLVHTSIGNVINKFVYALIYPLILTIFKTPLQGVQTTLYCALSREAVPGAYHADCQVGGSHRITEDKDKAKQFFEWSEKMVQLK